MFPRGIMFHNIFIQQSTRLFRALPRSRNFIVRGQTQLSFDVSERYEVSKYCYSANYLTPCELYLGIKISYLEDKQSFLLMFLIGMKFRNIVNQ